MPKALGDPIALYWHAVNLSHLESLLYLPENHRIILHLQRFPIIFGLREDIDSVYYGLYFCEFVDYITKENNDEKEILKLLYQTLRAVAKKTIELSLIRLVFEFKIMALSGVAPQVFECVKCQKKKDNYVFSVNHGGLLCEQCQAYDNVSVKLSTSSIYTLQYIISRDVVNLYTFRVSKEVLDELKACVKRYLDHYLNHEFKSVELLH